MILITGCTPISVIKPAQTKIHASIIFVEAEPKNSFTVADFVACKKFESELEYLFKANGFTVSDTREEAEIAIVVRQLSSKYAENVVIDYTRKPGGEVLSRTVVVDKIVFDISFLDGKGNELSRIHSRGFYSGFTTNVKEHAARVLKYSMGVFAK